MAEMTRDEYYKLGKELFGEDMSKWEFVCPSCGNIQSAASVREQMKKGIPSLRFGMFEEGDMINPAEACYAENCNWAANGLFSGPLLITMDPTKEINAARGDNCTYAFAFKGQKIPDPDRRLGVQKKPEKPKCAQPDLL